MNQKIHMEAAPVNVLQDVQKPGFDAAAYHPPDDVEDTNVTVFVTHHSCHSPSFAWGVAAMRTKR
jgi:hypothetical protein